MSVNIKMCGCRFWQKTVSMALAVISAVVCSFSLVCILMGTYEGIYDREEPRLNAAEMYATRERPQDLIGHYIYCGQTDQAKVIADSYSRWRFEVVLEENGVSETLFSNRTDDGGALMHEAAWEMDASKRYVVRMFSRPDVDYEKLLGLDFQLMKNVVEYRFALIWAAVLGFALFAACAVHLSYAAGRVPGVKQPVRTWQEKLPLEIYLFCSGVLMVVTAVLITECMETGYVHFTLLSICGGVGVFVVLGLALLMTLCVRIKTGTLWVNSITAKLIRGVKRLLEMLPVVWKGIVILVCVVVAELILATIFMSVWYSRGLESLMLLVLLAFNAALLLGYVYVLWQMAMLHRAAKVLAKGGLDHTVDYSRMCWQFKEHAQALNGIREGMAREVNERLKSERFKTDLIANVSHDLKTPLTSIVSYVDLLKNTDISEEAAAEYIEVLERQSARLKKLTEDLIEASKASSGVISVNLERLQAAEVIEQCLAEYAERLEKAGIIPVVNVAETEIYFMADGRLLWRVLDNITGNIVKYALPGTRAYFTVEKKESTVQISVKNISRDPLNLTAEQLLERFVRGDTARSGEGSGLGLNIAASLTQCMGGEFVLQPDGDMFKVLLRFPAA